jgi:hypothetical protein
MYRLVVWFDNRWKIGINEYATFEQANARVCKLAKVGIKAEVRTNKEIFD